VYDLKYHPLDDSIRPSQAAKRRSAHRDFESFSDDHVSDSFSVHAESDTDAEDDNEVEKVDTEKKAKSTGKSQKRARGPTRSPEPARRSSRRTVVSRVAYNMSIHPQDGDLEVSSSDDDESDASPPSVKRKKLSCLAPDESITHPHRSNVHSSEDGLEVTGVIDSEPDNMDKADAPTGSGEEESLPDEGMSVFNTLHFSRCCPCRKCIQVLTCLSATAMKTSSLQSSVPTPPPYGIRRKEGLDTWKLGLGERFFSHGRGSWPMVPGLPFEIYTERLEDQLATKAMTASPQSFDQDDKENNIDNSEFGQSSNIFDALSVTPTSQYRQSRENHYAARHSPLAADAFFTADPTFSADPYGLGGTDGVHDQHGDVISEAMSLLASGGQLPRTSTPSNDGRADEEDNASHTMSLSSSDSVIGRSSPNAIEEHDSVGGS
jgi:hypothetical protein